MSDQLQATTSAIGATVINGAQVGMLVTVDSTSGLERNMKKVVPSDAASYGNKHKSVSAHVAFAADPCSPCGEGVDCRWDEGAYMDTSPTQGSPNQHLVACRGCAARVASLSGSC